MNPEIQTAERADLVIRAICWLEVGSFTPRSMATLHGRVCDQPDRLALYLVLVGRLAQVSVNDACGCLRQPVRRCAKALRFHQPSQDEVTEWAKLIHEALLVMPRPKTMESKRAGATIPAWRRS
jgi:hypothetical protein